MYYVSFVGSEGGEGETKDKNSDTIDLTADDSEKKDKGKEEKTEGDIKITHVTKENIEYGKY